MQSTSDNKEAPTPEPKIKKANTTVSPQVEPWSRILQHIQGTVYTVVFTFFIIFYFHQNLNSGLLTFLIFNSNQMRNLLPQKKLVNFNK
jgi:hypothetical protein